MAFKGESYIPLIIRVKPAEGDIWRVRDNGMLFGIPLKGGDFIEWTGAAWQLRPDLHYKLDDDTGAGVQDEAITTEFAPRESGSYAAGTKRMYNGLLYIRNNTAGDDTEWVASHWTQTNVMAQMPNPAYAMPLVKGVNGIVTNNGRDLTVTGTNAWAEGRGTVKQVTCTADVTEDTVVPVSDVTGIKPGMTINAVGGYETTGPCNIVNVDKTASTITLDMWVTFTAATLITIMAGASGDYAHSEGHATLASGQESHAEGLGTEASGYQSHAEGSGTRATMTAAHAEGSNTEAAGLYSHSEGNNTLADGVAAHAGGSGMRALGNESFAHGNSRDIQTTVESVVYDDAEFRYVITISDAAPNNPSGLMIAGGLLIHYEVTDTYTIVTSTDITDYVHANDTITLVQSGALGNQSIAIGDGALADDYGGIAVGQAHAHGYEAIAMGNGAFADAYAVAIGKKAKATGQQATSMGYNAVASGMQSFAINNETTASGSNSFALGSHTEANGINAVAEGSNTFAYGYASHAAGDATIALGDQSHAEGFNTVAYGAQSHAEGFQTYVKTTITADSQSNIVTVADATNIAVGLYMMVGNSTVAIVSAVNGTAITLNVDVNVYENDIAYFAAGVALGTTSHTEGYNCSALGAGSHAEGYACSAEKHYSHAGGNTCRAKGTGSFVHGNGVIIDTAGGAAFGQFNADGYALFAVGNGQSNAQRADAFKIGTNNHLWCQNAQGTLVDLTQALINANIL